MDTHSEGDGITTHSATTCLCTGSIEDESTDPGGCATDSGGCPSARLQGGDLKIVSSAHSSISNGGHT